MSAARLLPATLAGIGFVFLAAVLLAAAGQPLITDDAWLHLALGRAYVTDGPWLDADPLLAHALGPPTPAAWLFDVAIYAVERTTGFAGLRILHVALVAGILGLAWSALRRAGGSVALACFGGSLFISLAAYRLIQLRPHLLSILAVLVVYRILLDRDVVPSRPRIAIVVLLFGVWANLHAAFLLGPLLVGAAVAALIVTLPLRRRGGYGHAYGNGHEKTRHIGLIATGALGLCATFVNPSGLRPHLAWFVSGTDTPSLGRVADEWARFDPFSLPITGLPPTELTFVIQWALMLSTVSIAARTLWSWRSAPAAQARDQRVDPALIGLALLGIALPLIAVRFFWLGIFPLLLVSQAGASWLATRPRLERPMAWTAALATLTVLLGFFAAGPWSMMRGTLPLTLAGYSQPYPPGKYHAHLIWMIRDAGLQGTAFADYHVASFAGAHLAPDVRMLINGTLNVSPDVIAANLPLRQRRGEREGEPFVDSLDRHGVDLFVGIRLPHVRDTARPFFHTTGHLEGAPGWIAVFRNLAGAVYLRADARNRENIDRVADWYADQRVPFDPSVGFDVERVVREARTWAMQHSIIPVHFDQLTRTAYGNDPASRIGARSLLASLYAALGLYEEAIELDEARVEADPDAFRARRRLVWCLLRLGRDDEASAHAGPLAERPQRDHLSHRIADAAQRVSETSDPELRSSLVAQLPVFDSADVVALTARIVLPAPRPLPR